MYENLERGRALMRSMRSREGMAFDFDVEELGITLLGRLMMVFVLSMDWEDVRLWLGIAVNVSSCPQS